MEQLNSVTLRMARFSVATDHAFKNRSGEAVIETTCYSNR